MEASAIYHSPDKRFCYALEKGNFLFRLKSKKNDLRRVTLHTMDKYIPIEREDTRVSQPMAKTASDGVCDYYEAAASFDVVCLRYFFELEDIQGNVLYYGNYQFFETRPTRIADMFDCPQNLREEERFLIPEWAANRVVYQIFPSRFASSQTVSDRVWSQAPIGARADLKGDLRGILDRLPHIRELGADIIYLTPVFQAGSCHKYDTVDYFRIDPDFGTEEDLRILVERAHALGLRVILDAVFNHTSRDFFAFRDILENGEKSAYLDWYYIKSFPIRAERGKKPSYKTFGYYGGMPKLNVRNPEVEDYLLGVARYWMRACSIDGWRLDVADEISHSFWKKFRTTVREENPEALIVGEAWHYTGDFLEGDEWDSIMNYDFRAAVLGFAAWGTVSPSQFAQRMGFLRGTVHTRVYPVLWNLIDSHDTERALCSCGENKKKFKLAAALQLLSPGMPMIYYGDEYGLSGGPDPDCRRGMPWKEDAQDQDLFAWYRRLLQLRREQPALTEGSVTNLHTDDQRGILAVTRQARGQTLTLVFYQGSEPIQCGLPAGRDLITGQPFQGTLQPWQALVLQGGAHAPWTL